MIHVLFGLTSAGTIIAVIIIIMNSSGVAQCCCGLIGCSAT